MEISLKYDGTDYTVVTCDDGWLYVYGPKRFHFIKDNQGNWLFSEPVNADFAIRLQSQVTLFPMF